MHLHSSHLHDSAKPTDVRKGYKVEIEFYNRNGEWVCTRISLRNPDDSGTVTDIGKDTVTIRDVKGATSKYKVVDDLANNTRPNSATRPSTLADSQR